MTWLRRIAQADLSWILSGPSEDSRVGPETGVPISDGISVYQDPYGSHRYVYYESGTPIAGIQVVSDGRRAQVANIYIISERRRGGLARMLFQRAQLDFPNLQHSQHRTDEGEDWITSLAQKPMALPYITEPMSEGTQAIDELMSPETAEEESRRYPNIDFYDAGAEGLISHIGIPGVLLKYTDQVNEVEAAEIQFEKKYPFVVTILEPPRKIQENPDLWAITMKEAESLDWLERDLVMGLWAKYVRYDRKYPTLDETIRAWGNSLSTDQITKIYNDYTELLSQMNKYFWVGDLHGRNVGYENGKMVILDLGGYGQMSKFD